MKLFDRKGRPVEVPDDHVHEALASGEYGAPKGTRIPVKMDGQIGTVPIESLGAALAGDAQVVPQSVYDKAELHAQYGDAGHGALALGAEAVNTATLGAGNALIRGIGGRKAAEEVRKSQEENKFATGVGTGIGVVLPIAADIASGGTLTPELAAVAAERMAAREAERVAVPGIAGSIAKQLAGAGERRLLGAGEAEAANLARAEATPLAGRPRPVLEGVYEPPIPVHVEEEMLGEVVPNAPGLRGSNALARRSNVIEGVLESGPRRLGAAPEEMLGEVIPNAPGLGGPPTRALPSNALARRPIEGVLEEVPRLGAAPEELIGEVVPNATSNLARGPQRFAPEVEAELFRSPGALNSRPLRAGGTTAEAAQEVGVRAVQDAEIIAPRVPPPIPLAPEVAAAEEAARVTRLTEAAQVVEEARAAGAAAERAAAEATGKGLIRQTVETSLFGPTRVVNGAGQAIENAVRSIVGRDAETALGRIAQDAVVKGARGATEGGIYAVGNEAGHQFLQDDPDLSGERLASAWFNGALLGGGFGVATGALGRGAKEAIGKVVGNEGIAKFLSDKAGEHMWHAAGGTKMMTANAEKYAGGAAKVGNLIREDAEQLMGRTPRTREELGELAELMKTKHNASLDAVLTRLDEEAAVGDRLKLGDLLKKVERVERDLKARAADHAAITTFKNNIVDAVEARNVLTGEVDLAAPVTFKQLRNFRVTADEKSRFNSTTDNSVRDGFRQLRHNLESEIEASAEPYLNKAGGSLLKDYKAAKAGYQAGKLLEKASGAGVAGEKTNQFLSLTDKIFGIGAGAVVGHATGPVGGFLSHQLAGYASKQVRKNFDFVVSDALAKLANVAKGAHVLDAAQATSERVQKRMDQGMRSVEKGLDGKATGEMPIVSGPKSFEDRRNLLLNLASQHEGVLAHLNQVTSPLNRAAPGVAAALNTAAVRTLTYLIDALPKPPPPPKDSLTPKLHEKNWKPSDPEVASFNRKWDMAVHPEIAPALVAKGAYTGDHDQALTATHAKMKADMGAKMRKELDRRTKAVPPSMRSSVKLFLGVPTVDKSLGRMMQANYATPQQPKPGPSSGLQRPLKLTNKMSLP